MSVRIALHHATRRLKSTSFLLRPACTPRIDPSASHSFMLDAKKQQWQQQLRWMTTNKPNVQEPEVLYEGPMGPLITPLKVFSLSSAIFSTIGMPAIILWRGMDLFTEVHMLLIGTTIIGSWSSTLALQWCFAPYVYQLERIPIRQCDYPLKKEAENEGKEEENDITEEKADDSTTITPQSTTTTTLNTNSSFLLKATTKSMFLTKVETVFDPETDVQSAPRDTMRPFASFVVKDKLLYIHEQMLSDPVLIQHLYIDHAAPIPQHKNPDPDARKRNNPDPDDEFL